MCSFGELLGVAGTVFVGLFAFWRVVVMVWQLVADHCDDTEDRA